MPQMAPLNWLMLMMMFILILVMFNITNYYSFSCSLSKKSNKTPVKMMINWKW